MIRQATALAAALAMTFASVVDNAASCREDGSFETTPGGSPSAPSPGCAEMPCHTPLLMAAVAWPAPALTPGQMVVIPYVTPASADAPPPPTPPPTGA